LALAIPEDARPFDRASGKLALQGRITRKTPNAVPDVHLQAKTSALELVGKGSPEPIHDRKQAKKQKPWRLREVDAELALDLVGSTGETRLEARAFDEHGTLAELETQSTLPRELLTARGAALMNLLWDVPIEAQLAVPERELACMPLVLRPAGVLGRVGGTFKVRGKPRAPELELAALGRTLRPKDPSFKTPIDVNATLHYKDDRTRVAIDASREGIGSLSARSEVDANLRRSIEGPGLDPNFRASADVKLKDFPLHTIPQLKERLVQGHASGQLVLQDLGKNASLRVKARVDRLEVGSVKNQTALFDIQAEGGKLTSQVELRHAGGFLRAKVDSGMNWGKRLVPELNHRSETRAELTADDYRIGSFQPFLAEQVSALDGRLDARLKSRSAGGKTTVEGHAELRDGVLQIPAIGQEFHDIRARVTAAPGGMVKVEDAQARGRQGRVRAAATARLEGLQLRSATARAVIREGEKLPLTTQGVEIGNAWGQIDTTLLTSADGKTTTVSVNAPAFTLELPDTKQHKVQGLDDAANIRVGVRVDPKKFQALPLQPLEEPAEKNDSRTIVNVTLGNDVWVRQGTGVRARLAGKIQLELDDEASIKGTIRIPSGQIDVSGKRFQIEHGTVTFQPKDPANPIVVATARYESPTGHRVYADFVGPVKTGKLDLRSEPALTKDQILSLLLFGTEDGSLGSGSGDSSTATAVGVGGSTATQGLNAALADITDADVSTRVDTSRGSPTPELVIQLSRRLSAEIGHNLGEPGLGHAPDRTFITLDFRIRRRWSLATTVGDHGGTSVDAIWRHRY
ncbi:MAG TPA: translocation/assembly module TamB domain-containing protein, partial [Polyangiaceae bacterium]|nr:translocation/assembly module TamB domain-containing protein [Polyangiaceae bacterium]